MVSEYATYTIDNKFFTRTFTYKKIFGNNGWKRTLLPHNKIREEVSGRKERKMDIKCPHFREIHVRNIPTGAIKIWISNFIHSSLKNIMQKRKVHHAQLYWSNFEIYLTWNSFCESPHQLKFYILYFYTLPIFRTRSFIFFKTNSI